MRNYVLLLFALCILVSCQQEESKKDPTTTFNQELEELQTFFYIPGLSAVIKKEDEIIYENYLGYADVERKLPVDASTAFPLASITKLYSATLVMKLVEQGALSLDAPVNQLITTPLSDAIQVKHLLSHTSQGEIGEQFFYSFRFGLLTQIIERASGKSFKALMEEEIFQPLALQQTFLLEDSSQLVQKEGVVAAPYALDGLSHPGFIDFGYSASAGVTATARDLLAFAQALDSNLLISQHSKDAMFQGISPSLPYAYGIFRQKIQDLDVFWVYGQYDCYSSLLLKVPARQLTLVLLANNNLMSDPARLIMGDISSSLFAISFLKNYVFNLPAMPLIEEPGAVYTASFDSAIYRKKVLAQALAESFMARYFPHKMEVSARLVEKTLEKHPDYLSYADINLLHTISFLKDVSFYMDLGPVEQFDRQLEKIGEKLLRETPNNPYVHAYLGTYYDRLGNKEQAKLHFKTIADLANFSPHWYTNDARNWLSANQ